VKLKGRNVVDMVVARLPAPDKLMKGKSGAKVASYDDGEDVGVEDAVTRIAKAFGAKLDDDQRQEVIDAFKDIVHICMHQEDQEEADEDETSDDGE
jgi:hypothetical protein